MTRAAKFGALMASVLMVGTPSQASAQCTLLIYGCEQGSQNHKAQGFGSGIGAPAHGDCMLCPGSSILECHDECNPTLASAMTRSALGSAIMAAERGDVRTVLAFGALLGSHVRFNAERQSLQIMSCTEEAVIANLKLTSPVLLAAASRLMKALDHELVATSTTSLDKSPNR